jgi:hypothetical protein
VAWLLQLKEYILQCVLVGRVAWLLQLKEYILQCVLVGRVAWLLRKVGLEKVAEAGAQNAWNLLF